MAQVCFVEVDVVFPLLHAVCLQQLFCWFWNAVWGVFLIVMLVHFAVVLNFWNKFKLIQQAWILDLVFWALILTLVFSVQVDPVPLDYSSLWGDNSAPPLPVWRTGPVWPDTELWDCWHQAALPVVLSWYLCLPDHQQRTQVKKNFLFWVSLFSVCVTMKKQKHV